MLMAVCVFVCVCVDVRLTALEDKKLRQERDELLAKMEELRALMQQDDKVFDVMRGELRDIKRKHAVPRRSVIKDEAAELTEMDLLANERCVAGVRWGWVEGGVKWASAVLLVGRR
jgi:DNA gyrase/topoisomerase IV subunit A